MSLASKLREKYGREFITVEELAVELFVSPDDIYPMIAKDELNVSRIGSSIRIHLDEVGRVFGTLGKEQTINGDVVGLESALYNDKIINAKTCYVEYIDYWLSMLSVKGSTKAGYRDTGKAIVRKIGKYPIGELTLELLKQVDDEFYKEFKYSTYEKLHRVLKLSLKFAIKRKLIVGNHILELKLHVNKTNSHMGAKEKNSLINNKALSPDEVRTIIEACKSKVDMYTIVNLISYTGVRPGEVRALKWSDVDFENKFIYINEAASQERENMTMNCSGVLKPVVGRPKSVAGVRAIPMNEKLEVILQEWKIYLQQAKEYAKARGSHLVFPSKRGNMLGQSGLGRRFRTVMEAHGLHGKGYELYSLRYSFANNLIRDCKVDIKTVQELMGHHKADVLLKYYLESDVSYKSQAIAKLSL